MRSAKGVVTLFNFDEVSRFPLYWPTWKPRTPSRERQRARFGKDGGQAASRRRPLSLAEGRDRCLLELRRVGAEDVIISSNARVRQDGLPRSGTPETLADPGVAVYFRVDGQPRVFTCDKWDKLADNLAAVAAHTKALRDQERYGVGSRAEAFGGYPALPAIVVQRPWWEVLDVAKNSGAMVVRSAFRTLAARYHPDMGEESNDEKMKELTAAYREATEELERKRPQGGV